MDSLTLRPALQSDQSDIIEILSHHIIADNLYEYYESLPTNRFFDVTDPTELYVAVTEEGDLIGLTALHQYSGVAQIMAKLYGETLPRVEDLRVDGEFSCVGYLATAYIHEDWMRQGVGRSLREHAEAAARDLGMEALFVEVWGHDEARDARRPLQRSGYEEVFWSDCYWLPSVSDDPEVVCSNCGADCECIGAVYRKLL